LTNNSPAARKFDLINTGRVFITTNSDPFRAASTKVWRATGLTLYSPAGNMVVPTIKSKGTLTARFVPNCALDVSAPKIRASPAAHRRMVDFIIVSLVCVATDNIAGSGFARPAHGEQTL
jgi:hypothetical protein